ncbi:MAG: ABC transporter permease subunit [Proteobacteria bacterium]|nr:ABC transporter permease subunit [Pseudomonadota bacterium]
MLQSLADMLGFVVNLDLLQSWGYRLLDGTKVTAEVVLISCGIGFLLSYPIARARMARNRVVSTLSLCYATFFRGTPLLCQLYLVYYGAGEIRPFLSSLGLWWFFRDSFYCCIFAFTLNTAAYQGEIVRGALQSVPKGQTEAARALGLSRFQIARHVVWPQAMLVALPPFGNELIGMIKASALAAIVTLLDLMGQTRFVFARTFDFSIYLYAALIYLAMTQAISALWRVMERGLSRHLVRVPEAAVIALPAGKKGQGAALDPLRAEP